MYLRRALSCSSLTTAWFARVAWMWSVRQPLRPKTRPRLATLGNRWSERPLHPFSARRWTELRESLAMHGTKASPWCLFTILSLNGSLSVVCVCLATSCGLVYLRSWLSSSSVLCLSERVQRGFRQEPTIRGTKTKTTETKTKMSRKKEKWQHSGNSCQSGMENWGDTQGKSIRMKKWE